MNDLRELYQEIILEHSKKPRNFYELPKADRIIEGFNPLCGDRLKLYLKLNEDKIESISFLGTGCAIFKASASMMTEAVIGKTVQEALEIFKIYHAMIARHTGDEFAEEQLGKLAVFSGVCEYPSRVKCAILSWHTLKSGLENKQETVTTES